MWQLIKKELLHILRDRGLLIFVIYAFTFDIYIASEGFNLIPENVSISVYDEDHSLRSRELIDRIKPPAFKQPDIIHNRQEIDYLLNESKTILALVIPDGFERDLHRNSASVQVLVDGTQSSAAYLSSAYLNLIIEQYSNDFRMEMLKVNNITGLPSIDIKSRICFNEEANDKLFEGINEFFMIITLIGMILPAAILIREKEYGTIEQIMISPLSIQKLLLMKVIAASIFLLSMIGFSYEFVLSLWLGFRLKGTILEFLLISLIYSFATTGLAFIIASIAKRLSQIGLLTMAIFAPMLLLSGGWVPPESLPDWLRKLTIISPMKYYMDLGISLLIRGASLDLLFPNMIKLLILGAIFMGAGYFLYDRRIIKGD
ncbi:MAG: ABC transporter permease [Thermodesulfovibrionales bacterium]